MLAIFLGLKTFAREHQNIHIRAMIDLFKSPSEKRYELTIMSVRMQRFGKGTNDDLFPLAGLLNINELGHMLHPRLHNNHAITLSGGTLSSVS